MPNTLVMPLPAYLWTNKSVVTSMERGSLNKVVKSLNRIPSIGKSGISRTCFLKYSIRSIIYDSVQENARTSAYEDSKKPNTGKISHKRLPKQVPKLSATEAGRAGNRTRTAFRRLRHSSAAEKSEPWKTSLILPRTIGVRPIWNRA